MESSSKQSSSKLGVNQEPITVDSSDELRLHIVNMVSQASNSINILSRKMDARLTNHTDFLDAIRSCIVGNSKFVVNILIYQLEDFLSEKHQIVELSQRLSSRILLRVLNNNQFHLNFDIILIDEVGSIYRELSDRYEATIEYNNKRRNQELMRQFDNYWEHGIRDNNFNRLSI